MILVTGGLGFVGYNTIKELLSLGHEVVSLDNGSMSVVDSIENVRCVSGDVRDFDLLLDLTKGVDFVFHFAAQVKVPLSVEDPVFDFKSNALGTLNVLEASRINGVKRVVFSSSAAVYGGPESEVLTEDMLGSFKNPYGLSKFTGEGYCRLYSDLFGLETVVLRYFNVFGLEKNTNVIGIFLERIRKGLSLVVYGSGDQFRDFVYIKDVVAANVLALEKEGVSGGVYNIGTGRKTSVNEVVVLLEKLIKKNLSVEHNSPRKGDVRGNVADISKAERELGYKPMYKLEDGFEEVISYLG